MARPARAPYQDASLPVEARVRDLPVSFTLGPEDLMLLDEDHNWVVEPGQFEVLVGGLKTSFAVVATP